MSKWKRKSEKCWSDRLKINRIGCEQQTPNWNGGEIRATEKETSSQNGSKEAREKACQEKEIAR
jgi:hypothetical protein